MLLVNDDDEDELNVHKERCVYLLDIQNMYNIIKEEKFDMLAEKMYKREKEKKTTPLGNLNQKSLFCHFIELYMNFIAIPNVSMSRNLSAAKFSNELQYRVNIIQSTGNMNIDYKKKKRNESLSFH